MDLISGYIILFAYEGDSTHQCIFRIWDSNSLMEYVLQHRNVDELNPPVLSRNIPARCTQFRISVLASPLEDEAYTIWILLALEQSTMSILKYRLSLDSSQQLELSFCQEGKCAPRDAVILPESRISYAGYFLGACGYGSGRARIFPLAEHIRHTSLTVKNRATTKMGLRRKKARKVSGSVVFSNHFVLLSFFPVDPGTIASC
jgi:hypothetical protein